MFFLYFINKLRFHSARKHSLHTCLLIQISAIGDAILSIPGINALREKHFRVTVLCNRANEPIYKQAGFETILFDLELYIRRPHILFKLISQLRARQFGYVIDALPWVRLSGLISGLLSAEHTTLVGFELSSEKKDIIYDTKTAHRNDRHEVENYWALCNAVTHLHGKWNDFFLFPEGVDVLSFEEIERLKQKVGFDFITESFICIHPWSGGYRGQDKEWPIQYYLTLANLLPSEYRLIVTGTSADAGRCSPLEKSLKFKIVAGKLSLRETMVVIKHSQLVLTINTGILHLAAILGKDIVCLNGPAGSLRWGGLQRNSGQTILNTEANSSCSPCLNLGFEFKCKEMICMPTIKPTAVQHAINTILSKHRTNKSSQQNSLIRVI